MKKLVFSFLLFSVIFCVACRKHEVIVNDEEINWIDISDQKFRHVVIAAGTPTLYNGHPTTVMLDDNKTIFCTWTYDHGGVTGFLAVSEDAGLTWKNLPIPRDWATTRTCPSIYNLKDKNGKERLMIFSAAPQISQTYSEDKGKTWTPVVSLNKPCVLAFSSVIQLINGNYLGLYHRGRDDQDIAPLTIWGSTSEDGGITWSESRLIGQKKGRSPCEPCVFRSPNGKQLVCIMRENQRVGPSLIMFSEDEGTTWSEMEETVWTLTGDRHVAKYTPDGRLVIVFRDMMPDSPHYGHFVLWVGRYEDIINKKQGQYRVKLLHSYAANDCGYPGLEILPDGTIIATTYIKYDEGENKHSIVSVRLKLEEIDNLQKK
jgi:hypothetical protein